MPSSPSALFRAFKAAYDCMLSLGFSKNEAIDYGGQYCRRKLGENPLATMEIPSWPISDDDSLQTPAELGRELGAISARTVNLLLARLGLQENMSSSPSGTYWVLTEKGRACGQVFAKLHPQEHVCSRQIKWKCSILPQLHRMLTL